MKVAIMQPYFFSYIGYFQLINAVDKFVIYDNIEYTKKGWINRNRFLSNGQPEYFTLPLKKDSDFLNIDQRYLSDNWSIDKVKVLNKIKNAYFKAPYFQESYELFTKCISYSNNNLFEFINFSIEEVCDFIGIKKNHFVVSSTLDIDNNLKSKDKVIAICKKLNAKTYINPIGGLGLYNKEEFNKNGIDLNFIKSKNIEYSQFGSEFVPFLSILDIIMFNNKDNITKLLNNELELL